MTPSDNCCVNQYVVVRQGCFYAVMFSASRLFVYNNVPSSYDVVGKLVNSLVLSLQK